MARPLDTAAALAPLVAALAARGVERLRFVDAAGNQLGPRMASAWDESIKDARGPSAAAVFLAATAALAATGRPLPRWVEEQLAALQSSAEL